MLHIVTPVYNEGDNIKKVLDAIHKAYFNGYKITELPTPWWDRTEGESRFNFRKWLPKYIRWYWFGIARVITEKVLKMKRLK